jgi:hypothetical protein
VQKEMKHLVFDKPFKRVCGFQRNSEAEWTGQKSYITCSTVCLSYNKWSQCEHTCDDITGGAAAADDNNSIATITVID